MKSFDFFGRNFIFSFDQSEKYKTNLGAFFTLLVSVSFIPLFFVFGSDIYQKAVPQVTTSSKVNYYNRTEINFDLPFAIGMYGTFGTDFKKYFNITTTFTSSVSSSSFTNNLTRTKAEFYPCAMSNFPNTQDKFDFLNLNLSYCLNKTYPLKGYSNTPNQTWIRYEIKECRNGSDIICAPQSDIDSTYDYYLTFFLTYQDYELTPQNYSFPIKYFLNQRLTPSLHKKFLKRYQIYVQDYTIQTDYGVFGTTFSEINLKKLDYIIEDIDYTQLWTKNIGEIIIFPSENSFLVQRTYIKLQNIFAQVFTIINLFFIVLSLFFNNIYESKMREIFYKKVYENYEEVDKGKQTKVKISNPNQNKLHELSNISNSNIQINNNILNNNTNNNLNNNLNNISGMNNAVNDNNNNNNIDVVSVSKFKSDRKSNGNIGKEDAKIIHNFKDLEISIFEYFAFIFCQCFQCNFNDKYGKLMKNIYFCVEKNDVIYITRKLIEIEKIKEILFDKEQLAEFNNIDNLMFLESECNQEEKVKKLSMTNRGSTRLRLI